MASKASLKTTFNLTPQLKDKLLLVQEYDGGDMAFHLRSALHDYLDKRLEFHVIFKKAGQLLSGLEGGEVDDGD